MNEDTKYDHYLFECTRQCAVSPFPAEETNSVSAYFSDNSQWTDVLYRFTNFLSSNYGYNINDRIMVDGIPFEQYISMTISEQIKVRLNEEGKYPSKRETEEPNFFMGSASDWDDEE